MLSKALEKSGVYQRLAIDMVRLVGVSSGRQLVFGFMLAAGFLSLWISNTATTLIMLSMALFILTHVENPKLNLVLILGIAYASSVGGIGTQRRNTNNSQDPLLALHNNKSSLQ